MKTTLIIARRNVAAILAGLLLTLLLGGAARAQTSAFTYQGRLNDSAAAANGQYDLQFALFFEPSGGTQLGGAITRSNVSVVNGIFTVQLDFGVLAFLGTAQRFVQISVRRSGEANFTQLAPRQEITAAPYAIRAATATTADTATNAEQLGGSAATNFLQTTGSGANLTNLNAASITTGTLSDAALSANVARRDTANTFTGNQTINGNLAQTGTVADLNTASGFVARGTFDAGNIPATGTGSRMMFYPGKAAFRAGRVFDNSGSSGGANGSSYWDDANVGGGSAAFGSNNRATGANSFAANSMTTASGAQSVAFGENSTASGERSFAFSGTASATSAIALGSGAQATGDEALALGPSSIASGFASVAIGPSRATGSFAVAIGLQNIAKGNYSLALGKNATDCSDKDCAVGFYSGVISISDGCAGFTSDRVIASANNQVNIRGCGGFRFFTNQALTTGVMLAAGGGAWSSISDRNMKENFQAVNSRDILQRVLKLPISTWNYKSQDASIRHIGAMAQDFKAAFAVGESDKMIATIDPDGVAFAAIQGLNDELNDRANKLEAQNDRLQKQLQQQQTTIDALKKLLCASNSTADVCRQP